MIIENFKLINDKYVGGYFLTIQDLTKLVRDFQADCHDGFVSNDKAYIELWLKNHDSGQIACPGPNSVTRRISN